jgi:hypothetical protein
VTVAAAAVFHNYCIASDRDEAAAAAAAAAGIAGGLFLF